MDKKVTDAAIVTDLVRHATQHQPGESRSDESCLIGLFQAFRPVGLPEDLLLDSHPAGAEIRQRLQAVYDAVASSRRADKMRDAYFIVRQPPSIAPPTAIAWAKQLVEGLRHLCMACELELPSAGSGSDQGPGIRVLEGKAPKHPRSSAEKSALLRLFESELPACLNSAYPADGLGHLLEEPLYFMACDHWLSHFIRWPLASLPPGPSIKGEVFPTYFQLWRSGIKLRIFNDRHIDFYLPRQQQPLRLVEHVD